MKLRSLAIERLPGIDQRFEISDLTAGFNVIVGPNGIGKSSLCRATRALWWSSYGREGPLTVSARVEHDGQMWRVEREGAHHEWQLHGEASEPPHLPPAHLDGCFFLLLRDLLDASPTAGADVAAEIRTQMAGGFDLDEALSHAFESISGRFGRNERARLDTVDREIKRAEGVQADLRRREEEVAELEARKQAALAAGRRLKHFERALELQEIRSRVDEIERSLAGLPDGLDRLQGGELSQLDQRGEELERLAARRREAEAALDRSQTERRATGLPAEIDTAELQAWRGRATGLKDIERDLRGAREDLEAAHSELEESVRGLGADAASLAGIDLADDGDLFALLRESQELTDRQGAIDSRLRLLEAPDAHEGPAVDRLRAAVEALRAWLRAPSPDAPRRSGSQRNLWIAVALLVVIGAAGAAFLHPLVVVLAGLGIGLAIAAFSSRPDPAALAAREAARREFQRQDVPGPSGWREWAVDERLRDLENEFAERSAAESRADRRAADRMELEIRREEIAAPLAEMEQRWSGLRSRLGLADGVRALDVVDTARALDQRRRAGAAHQAAEARVEEMAARHGDRLTVFMDFLIAHGEAEPSDAASAGAGIESLSARDAEYRRARSAGEDAQRALEETADDIAEARRIVEAIFSEAGLESGDRVGLARRIDALEEHRDLNGRRAGREVGIEQLRAKLDEAGELDLADRDADALAREAQALEDEYGKQDTIQAEISAIDAEIRRARGDHDLEEHLAERCSALEALREKRDAALLSRAGEFLIETVRNEHETNQAPRVLERARELFSIFTHHAYRLSVPSGDSTSFRAIDSTTERGHTPEELSDGTRAQLLLAVRLAFAEDAEHGAALPVFLDEALDVSDPARFDAIARSLGRMAGDDGRQFVYLTADPVDVARIQAAFAAEGCEPAKVIDLGALRTGSAAVAEAGELEVPPLPDVPVPGDLSAEEYGALLRVPPLDPRRGHAAQHLFHLLWDDLPLLQRLLELRVERVGVWRTASRPGGAAVEDLDSGGPAGGQLGARADLLEEFCRLWSEGRGRPVNRDTLESSNAVSSTYIQRVSEVARDLGGEALALIESLHERKDERLSGYRRKAADDLEAYLADEGYLDTRPVLGEEEILARLVATRAASRLPGRIAAECAHRWWALGESGRAG